MAKQERKVTLGSSRFNAAVEALRKKNHEVGVELGCSPSLVSALRRGAASPQGPMRIVIESTYGIARADWDLPVEEAKPDPIKEALQIVVEKLGYRLL